MKISYVNSVCVRNDAISNAIRDEFAFLRNAGYHDIRLFAFTCDDPSLPFTECKSVSDIARNKHFLDSDIVVFHFGIYYSLFNLFPMIPKKTRKVVVFHNITPAELVPPKDRWLIEKSFAQIDNMTWADLVICDSRTNLDVLRVHGLTTPALVHSLAVHTALKAPERKPSFKDEVVRIAFVGRFTQAKGPLDLLQAVEAIVSEEVLGGMVQVDFIGNLSFSDPTVIAAMQRRAEELTHRFGKRLLVRIHGNAPDELKHAILQEADIFALPTYHEGFCVPIVEAIASGCRVVAYDNSNTPGVSGRLGNLVPTGSIQDLQRALQFLITTVCSQEWRNGQGVESYTEYVQTAKRHVHQFSPDNVSRTFVGTIRHVAAGRIPVDLDAQARDVT